MSSENKKKGFAGLESMVSKVEKPDPPPPSAVPQSEPASSPPPKPKLYQGKPSSSSGSGSDKWWAIGILVIFIWAANSGSKSSSSAPSSAAATAPERAPAQSHGLTPPQEAAPAQSDAPAPSYGSLASSSNQEEVPPVGNGLSFSRNQIRYCLSEKIRIEAWQNEVNQYSESSVDAFNFAVNDYNARCSNFQYRVGSLESVRSEVEAIRYALAAEGIRKAQQNP